MNTVLQQGPGVRLLGAQPSFDGHELCPAEPWVQGTQTGAVPSPAAGELAITAAVLPQLPS